MPKSRIPSPARSQSALVTPRRLKPRGPRSVGSPARSNTSVRLTSVIQNFKDKNMDSFRLSPLTSRRSVLNDNTDIEEPRRHSWWKNLNDTSRDILDVLENDKQEGAYNVMDEYMEDQVLSQEKKDKHETLDLPLSSDNESVSSIVIPQRKLFTQKENQPKNKFSEILGTRETISKHNKTNIELDKDDKTIVVTKKLFGQSSKPRAKPAFPTELLRFSPDKTINKTVGEVKGQVRNLFGNRAGVKRKNKFADFIASESEEEPEIQPKVFAFQKKNDVPSRRVSTASRGGRDTSPTSSITADIDMDDWKLLPSSTMVQTQLEAMIADSPAKKAKLSKLSEGKESEAATNNTVLTNKTKQSNKSIVSKNKSKLSTSKTSNKSKMSPEANTSFRKSAQNRNEYINEDQNIQLHAVDQQDTMTHNVQSGINAAINKSKESNKSLTAKNQSKINNSMNASTKSIKQSKVNETSKNVNNEVDVVDNSINVNDKGDKKNIDESTEINNIEEEKENDKESSVVQNESEDRIDNNENPENEVNEEVDQVNEIEKLENEQLAENNDIEDENVSRKVESNSHQETEEDENEEEIELDEENQSTERNDREEEKENDVASSRGQNESQVRVDNDEKPESEVEEPEVDQQNEIQELENEQIIESDDIEEENVSQEIESDAHEEADNEEDDNDEEIELEEENDGQENQDASQENQDASQEIEQDHEIESDGHEEREVEDEEENDEEMEVEEQDVSQKNQDASTGIEESNEVESDAHEETENEDKEEDENDEDIALEYENDSEENQDDGQEIEESHEVEEGQASEDEENQSQEIVNTSGEVIDESDGNDEGANVETEINATEESPNVTHDTTGRNRRKDETQVRSPEAVLKNGTDHIDSFTAKGRNTSIRRTTLLKSLNLRPSLARDSTGTSDGTKNSSAEGSGWDSHRTTRKTLRQTFGRDFSPRKSLRALVMEKSAKRNTVFNDVNDADMPRANSTELPEDSNRMDDNFEDQHEISQRTRQTTLEMYLQKIKKQNMEKKKKLEEEVRNSLSAPSKDTHIFKVPSRPFVLKRAKLQTKPKTNIKSSIPLESLPQDLIEDMKYKPPKRFQPSNASWITKRLYKFLESKLEPKYDYKARVRAEKLVETIYNFVKDLRRHDVAPQHSVDVLKQEMARLCVVDTHFEFYQFFHDYLPREVRVKVVPDVVNKIPLPRHGVFTEIQRGNTVQG